MVILKAFPPKIGFAYLNLTIFLGLMLLCSMLATTMSTLKTTNAHYRGDQNNNMYLYHWNHQMTTSPMIDSRVREHNLNNFYGFVTYTIYFLFIAQNRILQPYHVVPACQRYLHSLRRNPKSSACPCEGTRTE